MTDRRDDRLRLTVLGCTTAAPHPAAAAAGFLVEWGRTALLLDVGQGVVRELQQVMDPHDLTAIVVGHMHADHYLDLVGLRYLYPWGTPAESALPVYLPPGGRAKLDALATAISERSGFFDASFEAVEFEPDAVLRLGELSLRFVRGRHYVPAWGVVVEAPDGARLAYTGDTGPSDVVATAVHGADLLLVEAALPDASLDDEERGHLTGEEAIELARVAAARSTLIVHYDPARRGELDALCSDSGFAIGTAVSGLAVTVNPSDIREPARGQGTFGSKVFD